MKTRRFLCSPLQATLLALLLPAALHAEVVNIDLTTDATKGPAGYNLAGVIGKAAPVNWNPVGDTTLVANLIDEDGNPTSIDFQLTGTTGAVNTAGLFAFGGTGGDADFFRNYAYLTGTGTPGVADQSTFTIGGLTVGQTCDICFYATWEYIDAGSEFRVSSDGGATWTPWATCDGVPSESNAAFDEGSSYVFFDNIAPHTSGEILGEWRTVVAGDSANHRGPFTALQIERNTGPAPLEAPVIAASRALIENGWSTDLTITFDPTADTATISLPAGSLNNGDLKAIDATDGSPGDGVVKITEMPAADHTYQVATTRGGENEQASIEIRVVDSVALLPLAGFDADFPAINGGGAEFDGSETPAPGWSYLWNPNGELPDSASFAPQALVPNTVSVSPQGGGPIFTNIGNLSFNNAGQGNFQWGRIAANGSSCHPGLSGADYRPIIAYTIQPGEEGDISIVESALSGGGSNGIDLDVYLNTTKLGALSLDGVGTGTFDTALGPLGAGDTVYVTVGHNGNNGSDAFYIDFKLAYAVDADLDSDGDGLKDVWEIANFGDLAQAGTGNPDGDGANNEAEETAGTDPNDRDSDDDGLDDDVEIAGPTDPLDPDSDDDQLLDGVETDTGTYVSSSDTGTDPMLADTDGDGALDGAEIARGSDPFDNTHVPGELPNIIFIMVDDLDTREIGPYGQISLQTPELDTMATQGMLFTDYYCPTPICQSTRSCLITGQDSRRSQDRHNGEVGGGYQYPLNPARVTIAEVLKQAGYTTACIGKWGMGGPTTFGVPWNQGFDFFFGYLGQVQAHHFYPKYLWKNDRKVYLNQALATAEGGTLYVAGADNPDVATDSWDDNFGNVCSHDLCTREALDFLDGNAGKPFFLYLPYTAPHGDRIPAARLSALTDADGLLYDPTDLDQTVINETYPGAPFGGTVASPDYAPHCHASMVSAVDRDVGRILDKVAALGIESKTLVIFCSDNGQAYGTFVGAARLDPGVQDFRGGKGGLYEGGIRTPFIARWPGKVPAGTTSDVIGTFSDLLPTCAEMAGLATPSQITGRSILPALLGGTEADLQPRDYHYWFFNQGSNRLRVVRQGNWKLHRSRATDGSPPAYQLFDLANDLYETTPLNATHPDVLNRLIPLVEGTHEPTDAKSFNADDEFFTKTDLAVSAHAFGAADGAGGENGYSLAPTGTGDCFNYLPFETGLNEPATFSWTMQFPTSSAASLLLGATNDATQCLAVRIDAATPGLELSYTGASTVGTTIAAADFPGSRAECTLTINPVTGAGKITIGSTLLPFDLATNIGPLQFWGYEVETAPVRTSRPRWTLGAAGPASILLVDGPGILDAVYELPATIGQTITPQYSTGLGEWHDNPPGLIDIRATNSQGRLQGSWHLPKDSLLPRNNDRLFLRARRSP